MVPKRRRIWQATASRISQLIGGRLLGIGLAGDSEEIG